MVRNSESETEILLGNKQLLGIFFVVAVLLGIAFTGGYMVGRDSLEKKMAEAAAAPAPAKPASAVETHAVPSDTSASDTQPGAEATSPNDTAAEPLGSAKSKNPAHTTPASDPAVGDDFAPKKGQLFLQVAAVGRDEAEGIADVLRRKGFHAHSAPKPGNPKLYRVLIGPIHDTADLSSTRDSLRKTGFRDVIAQHY
jgi:cell division septation protein DedD